MKLRAMLGLGARVGHRAYRASAAAATPSKPINLANEADNREASTSRARSRSTSKRRSSIPTNHRIFFKLAMAYGRRKLGQGRLDARARRRSSRRSSRTTGSSAATRSKSRRRRRRSLVGRGEGAVQEVHRERSELSPTATTSSATPTCGPTTSRRRSRTTRRRSSTSPTSFATTRARRPLHPPRLHQSGRSRC